MPSREVVASVLPKLENTMFLQKSDIEINCSCKGRKKRAAPRPKRTASEIPLSQKELLTLQEAAAYTGIGINRLRRMSDDENCGFVIWVGSKRMLKRRELEKYLAEAYSV